MKLLFDENISPKLPRLLDHLFPGSRHARECHLKGKPDADIWEYARANGFTLVSKDGDFYQRSLLFGAPPKVVWLLIGNCTRQQVLDLLIKHQGDIQTLESASETVLLLH